MRIPSEEDNSIGHLGRKTQCTVAEMWQTSHFHGSFILKEACFGIQIWKRILGVRPLLVSGVEGNPSTPSSEGFCEGLREASGSVNGAFGCGHTSLSRGRWRHPLR